MRIRCVLVLIAFTAAACVSAPRPITKIVNGRIVVTRPISPEAYNHVARALLYEEEERWEEAAQELQRALPFDPDAAEIRAHLAELFVRLARLDDAAEQVTRSLQIAPTVAGHLAAAKLAEERARQPRARNGQGLAEDSVLVHLRAAVALALGDEDPAEIEQTHLALSEALLGRLDVAAAHEVVTALVRALPGSANARVEQAALCWSLGRLAETDSALRAAIQIDPSQLDARLMLGALLAALGRAADAKAAFRDTIERTEDAVEVAEPYLRWLVGRGDRDEAATEAERLAPDVVTEDTVENIGRLYLAAGQFERAKQAAETALSKATNAQGSARVILLLAQAMIEAGDRVGAASRLLKVAKDTPGAAEARLLATEALREAGRFEEAARALEAAATAKPLGGTAPTRDMAVEVAVSRALLDEKRGDAARAARTLDQALADAPNDTRLLMVRAAVEERRGEWRRALGFAERILAREPRKVEALNFHGFISADHGFDLANALRRLHTAVALDPGGGGIVDSLGWAYLKAGDVARAKDLLTQADRLEPGDPEILSHLADLYVKQGDVNRALTAFRAALGRKPSDRLAKEIETRVRDLEAKRAAGRTP